MIKNGSPSIRELFGEATREGRAEGRRETGESMLLTVLTRRFGAKAQDLQADLKSIGDDQWNEMVGLAATCPDLASFREHLRPRKSKSKSKG